MAVALAMRASISAASVAQTLATCTLTATLRIGGGVSELTSFHYIKPIAVDAKGCVSIHNR